MNNNDNSFKNIVYEEKNNNNGGFRRNFFMPFISGILGCSIVLGTCFGVPSIKSKLIGDVSSTSTSSSTIGSTTSQTSSGETAEYVSLSNYSDTAISASSKILPSIVGIKVTYNVTSNYSSIFGSMFNNGNPNQTTQQATASGSGIIISSDGYILTNNHVVSSSSSTTYYDLSEATSVKITLYNDETEYDAKIIGKDSQTDLAVLKIDKSDLTVAEFANSDSVKVGEFSMAVGNPLSLGTTITCGVISAINRTVEDSDGTNYTCIQTDAAINSGNSGGALVNSEGKVIGVNTLKLSGTGVEGIGFAIPINSTIDITEQLINYSKVKRPYIGITGRSIDENTAKQYNLVAGVYIASVEEYSAAEKAGLKAGDVITEFDGKTITSMDELNEVKNSHKIGDELSIKIFRNSQEKTLTITLGESE